MKKLQLAALSAAISALLPSFACAQETEQTLDRVTVTGTRIKKADVTGQSPVRVLTAEDLQKSGIQSIGEVLQQLTASGNSLNVRFNSSGNFGYPPSGGGVGAGSAQVDLRHLGSNRVLVLVDGIRWINESSASGVSASVDLNTIPMAIVDSIEVLEDGASSIYGSDAIAGVINIITKRDMDGGVANVQYGEYLGEGDGENVVADISYGKKLDALSFVVSASYYDQKSVNSIDRAQARFPVPGGGLTFASSATPEGRFRFTDPRSGQAVNLALNRGVVGRPRYDANNPTGPNSDYNTFDDSDRFNFAPFNLVITPSERKGIFGQVRYEFSETTTGYAKLLYNERDSVNQAAPEPIFIGFGAGTGGRADTVSISRTNPFNPFGIDLNATGPNANFRFLGRRPIEGGPRIFEQNVQTTYFGAGLEGSFDLGERSMSWDLNFVRAKNDAEQKTRGSYNIANIARGLGPIANCTAPCVPINFFGGPGTLTPEMLNYIAFNGTDTSEQNLTVLSANVTGDLFDFTAAGPVSFAAGVEHRRLDGRFDPDPIIVRGDSNGVPAQPGGGKYSVDEIFAEFNLPLLADQPWAKRLDLSVAGRYSDYSTSSGDTNGKLTARWQPSDSLTFRSTYAEGFRAPSIGELFGGPAQFDAVLQDPCNASASRPAGCTTLGVPANYRQTNPQISVVTGGNPALVAESAKSLTGGAVFSPEFARDTAFAKSLDFEVTYYRHRIADAIQALDAQTQLNLCVANPTGGFCNGITRVQTGEINGFQNRLQNFGNVETDGVDFTVNWRLPDSDLGSFGVAWSTTHVNDYEAKDAIGTVDPRRVGRELNDGSIPRVASNIDLNWERSIWSANWNVRYVSGVDENCGEDFQGFSPSLCSNEAQGFNHLGGVVYHDVKLAWQTPLFNEGLTLSTGVNNLFEKEPPICITCSLNGYDASTYDIPNGRFAYVKANMKF